MSPLARARAYLAYREEAIASGKHPVPYAQWCNRQTKIKIAL